MPGGFTGNGSVRWFVDANRVKGTPNNQNKGSGKYHQDGADTTDVYGRFTITIKHPTDKNERDAFRQALYDAWSASNAGAQIATFSIPIEDKQSQYPNAPDEGTPLVAADYQIFVDWS
jgi:hypothetical protein